MGDRQASLRFVARFNNGSDELTRLKAQTTGTAVIKLQYDADNSLEFTYHRVSFQAAEIGDADGIVTVSVDCLPQYHNVNGILTAVAKCGVDEICG